MRRCLAGLCAGLLILFTATVVAATTAQTAAASSNGLTPTPPMGWNDWNAYQCNNNWQDIEQTALFIHTSGLQADGYHYVNNDGCWDDMVGLGTADPSGHPLTTLPPEACGAVGGRLPDGEIFVNPTEFPPSAPCANDGLAIVAKYVHSLGLKFGLYLDASNNWNSEEIPGSYGFDQQDAKTFASWGVDYVKADWGASATTVPPSNDPLGGPTFGTQPPPLNVSQEDLAKLMYTALGNALATSGRPMVFSIAGAGVPNPQDWGPAIANMVRPAGDSASTFANLLNIVNTDDQYAADQHNGTWIDPDVMEVGNGMTNAEDQSEMSLFSVMSWPLLMSTNLVNPAGGAAQQAHDLSIFGNKDVIAVDQDPLGKMATLISSAGGLDVFAKPLANGDVAVALFNTTNTAATITTDAASAGLPSNPVYEMKDLWSKHVSETAGTISAFVAPHATALYRISAPHGANTGAALLHDAPNTTLSITTADNPVKTAASTTATVTLTNNAAIPVSCDPPTMNVPSGWDTTPHSAATSRPSDFTLIKRGGGTAQETFTVSAPVTAPPISTEQLEAAITCHSAAGSQTQQADINEELVAPVQAPYLTANTTGTDAAFGQAGDTLAIDAAGIGVAAATSRGPATDQYGAIYLPGGADSTAVVQATISAQAATGRNAKAGLMIRNDATASAGSAEGAVLYLTGTGSVAMSWAAGGSTVVDTSSPSINGAAVPIHLRITRNGTAYTGAYSTDGTTWTTVATATLPGTAANDRQDAAVFATTGIPGSPQEADFTGFSVTG